MEQWQRLVEVVNSDGNEDTCLNVFPSDILGAAPVLFMQDYITEATYLVTGYWFPELPHFTGKTNTYPCGYRTGAISFIKRMDARYDPMAESRALERYRIR